MSIYSNIIAHSVPDLHPPQNSSGKAHKQALCHLISPDLPDLRLKSVALTQRFTPEKK